MTNVDKQLQSGEEILYRARPSKVALVPIALLALVIAIVTIVLSNQPDFQQPSLAMRLSRERFAFRVGFGPQGQVVHRRVTLAPPLARAVCRIHPRLYPVLNAVPLLRTHVLAWIAKP